MRYLAGLVVSLAFAAPAMAQEPLVGEPQVVTDQASETEPAPPEPEPDATYEGDGSDIPAVDDGTPAPEPAPDGSGRRGEIHVLEATSASSPPPAATKPAATASSQLPFTGDRPGVLAAIGLALLAAGALVRRQLSQTF